MKQSIVLSVLMLLLALPCVVQDLVRSKIFQEEYLGFLRAHGIEYDERYLWGWLNGRQSLTRRNSY